MAELWLGYEVDPLGDSGIGRAQGFFVDADSGERAWLVAALGRRGARVVAVPMLNCAEGGGRVWVAHDREALRTAPAVDPTRPLLREHELAICEHFGIGEKVGRAAEVAGRPEGAITSRPG